MRQTRTLQRLLLLVMWFHAGRILDVALCTPVAAEEIVLAPRVHAGQTGSVSCRVAIRGRMITPAETGTSEMKLSADAVFEFDQRQFPSRISGPFALRGVRSFREASVTTIVGADHRTDVRLPDSHRLLQVYGTDSGLLHLSSDVRLTRQQVDLLQLPCDPLAATGLLPNRPLQSRDEKWNVDDWVLPLLVGMEAVITQSTTCELVELTEQRAVIRFQCTADGASAGSASQVSLNGQLTLDRLTGTIIRLQARQLEQRSPGTVSPGLNVTADVQWSQTVHPSAVDLPVEMPEQLPDPSQLKLSLSTPWRLMLSHGREWHLFHETSEIVVLRMLRHGSLIGQLNISPELAMPAGEFTPDHKFREDVQKALVSRQAAVVGSTVNTRENGWRTHFVRAVSKTSTKSIHWDYYLCTWSSGEQFLLIFSHAEPDEALFADAADRILETLTMAPLRPKIRVPR